MFVIGLWFPPGDSSGQVLPHISLANLSPSFWHLPGQFLKAALGGPSVSALADLTASLPA